MPPNRNNLMQQIAEMLEGAAKLAADAQRARALDAFIATTAPTLAVTVPTLFANIAKSPVWDTLREVVQDAAALMLEEESFSPCEAAKPAHHLLQALDTIKRGGVELQRWKVDARFNMPRPPKKPIRDLFIHRPPPTALIPVAEIVEQLAYLMGLLTMAGKEAHLASEAIMHGRDPLLHIVAKQTPLNLPHIEPPQYFIPLPVGKYVSQGDKGRDLLTCVKQFGDFLVCMADRGRERLQNASIDNKAFSPGVVAAEAIAISNLVKNSLGTCDGLAVLAWQFIGDSVQVEYIETP